MLKMLTGFWLVIRNMENRNFIQELESSESINLPNFLDGLLEGLNAASDIADENKIDLHSLPKFVELQDFVLTRLKDS